MSRIETAERSFENTLAFVTDERVTSVPVDTRTQIPSRNRKMTQAQWERNWSILGEYLGTDKTLEEIGRDRDLTRERVRQIVGKGVKQLHEVQSPEVQDEYPLDSLSYSKPLPLPSRKRTSKAHGGLSVEIEQALLGGQKISQIKEEFSSKQIGNARRILGGWG